MRFFIQPSVPLTISLTSSIPTFFQWVFEPIDREGKDLVDPNTLKYPSILGPGTSGGGNTDDGGTASATDTSSKAYVATLRNNGAAFRYVTSSRPV